MKPLKYNFFYPYPSDAAKYIAYNSFSNALALIETENYNEYKKFIKDRSYKLDSSLIQELCRGHFVIEDDVDEIELIRHRLMTSRYSSAGLGLTLVPTSDCNFRCIYCYEKDSLRNTVMTDETQQLVINLVKNSAPSLSNLHISWFGGEPLLALDIIEKMTHQFLSLAKMYSFEYSASIVTNGYLLTPDYAKRLRECKITSCQITLDGDAEGHNLRRPHVSGEGTYDVILKNIQAICGILPFIALRVNIDHQNKSAIEDVNRLVHNLELRNVRAYPAPIQNTNGCCNTDSCLRYNEFFNFEYDFIKNTNDDNRMLEKYPGLRGHACGADALNSYSIDADGRMYKCWSDIGIQELSLGRIDLGIDHPMNEILYMKNDPTHDAQCVNCQFLPICMGGCPYDKRTENLERCLWQYQLHQMYLTDIAKIANENNRVALHKDAEKRNTDGISDSP